MSNSIPPLTPKDGESKDLVAENIERLKQLFPEIITDGKVDFEALKEVLGDFKEESQERYSFTWNGKSKARKLAMTPSRGTLRPAPEESVNWDTTENLFIEGDNLEVLKLLQRSYHNKVKMIYIDPPYNTGKDFVYPDDYKDNIGNYLKLTEQVDGDGKKISSNPEYSGRFHTDWLNMLYPRLLLGKEVLRDDGVIFISIDDTEVANLRKLCDDVLGEDNFIANVVWEKKYTRSNDARWFSDNHDHILIYAKNKDTFRLNQLPREEKQNKAYTNPDNHHKGRWKSTPLHAKSGNVESFSYTFKNNITWTPPKGTYPRFSKERLKKLEEEDAIWFGNDGTAIPSRKSFLSEVKSGITPITIWDYKKFGHNHEANDEVKKLGLGGVFDTPKPTKLLKNIIQLSTDEDDLILDFFAGSCTSADAMFQFNFAKSDNRKFIMIQLPELTKKSSQAYKQGFSTIADIGKERIRRAASKIKQDNPKYEGDLGFKVFKLDSSNIKPWDPNFGDVQLSIEDSIENIKADRTEQDVLYEIMLKYGLDLTLPIQEKEIAGTNVFVAGAGALFICLSQNITLKVVEGIAELKAELAPEITRVVFSDSGFKSDVVKTNAVQILKQHGIEDVRSI